MAGAGTRRSGHDLLGIYLNDHLAGATGGLELARRVAGSHRGPAADGALPHWRTACSAGRSCSGGNTRMLTTR
jgi:hypothetical protein